MDSFNHRRTVRKSEHWHMHGKHASVLPEVRRQERERKKWKRPMEWFATVQEAFASLRRKGR